MASRQRPSIMTWLPTILWAVVIFVLSTVKTPEIEPPGFFISWDKIGHFIVYACLALLMTRPLRYGPSPMPLLPAALLAFSAASGYGIIMEVYQNLVNREMELGDALANIVGAAAATSIYLLVAFMKNRTGRQPREQREYPAED